jgi:hypothetical protein
VPGRRFSDHRLGKHSIFTHLSYFNHGLGSDRQLVDIDFGTSRQLLRRGDMSGVGGKSEVTVSQISPSERVS